MGEDLIERILLAVIRTLDGYDPPALAFQSCDLEMDDQVHNFRLVGTNARPNHINSATVFIVGDNPTVRNVSVVIVLILKLPLLQSYNSANGCFSRQPIVHSQGIPVDWEA